MSVVVQRIMWAPSVPGAALRSRRRRRHVALRFGRVPRSEAANAATTDKRGAGIHGHGSIGALDASSQYDDRGSRVHPTTIRDLPTAPQVI